MRTQTVQMVFLMLCHFVQQTGNYATSASTLLSILLAAMHVAESRDLLR